MRAAAGRVDHQVVKSLHAEGGRVAVAQAASFGEVSVVGEEGAAAHLSWSEPDLATGGL